MKLTGDFETDVRNVVAEKTAAPAWLSGIFKNKQLLQGVPNAVTYGAAGGGGYGLLNPKEDESMLGSAAWGVAGGAVLGGLAHGLGGAPGAKGVGRKIWDVMQGAKGPLWRRALSAGAKPLAYGAAVGLGVGGGRAAAKGIVSRLGKGGVQAAQGAGKAAPGAVRGAMRSGWGKIPGTGVLDNLLRGIFK